VSSLIRRLFVHALEPELLFPALAVVLLSLLWIATFAFVRLEGTAADQNALALTRELTGTYEAQVVRAVREIDNTLKVVKYGVERRGGIADLEELKDRALLPPGLLFAVAVADRQGKIVASTKPLPEISLAGSDVFEQQRRDDALAVGLSRPNADSSGWTLEFSRRLVDRQGAFAGVALLAVDAEYFVSGYESAQLGAQGLLGLVGTDGIFRVRRTGEALSVGDRVDYAATALGAEADVVEPFLAVASWDGVARYTGFRRVYDAPLTVVVGLSKAEQMSRSERDARSYYWRAAAGSVLILLVVALLGRTSSKLAQSRRETLLERMEHAKQVEYLAYHDGLTGLPNRSLFSRLLHQAIQQAGRHDRTLALLFLDLDRFKHINDTLGHEAGDQLLKEVARRLRSCLRESDTVARLGGDEFVVLLPELTDGSYAAVVAQKALSSIAKPFKLVGQEFRVTGSIGIATHPQDGLDEEALTKNADIAMYKAKEQGKNNYQFYAKSLSTDSLERLTLESSLRQALERGEFELYYQAKRELETGRMTGMEALLRWQHPDLGTVAPMRFIPLAEQTGLIIPIGRWVLRTACLQNVAWQAQGLPELCVSVNLTARQCADDNLVRDVEAILKESGLKPALLELEIAESMLLHDVEGTLPLLAGLKALGVRIAIDDFGMGYSTISSLRRFPIDTIKIDRSFIRDVATGEEDKALTRAIIAMGKTLSMTVVAQGVETKAQAAVLREYACDELQGFYFSQPAPAAQFRDTLLAQASAPTVTEIATHRAKLRG
jgi:diguanylate cyclase (GGDEF)-like protein